jgi:anti-sigma factor RsiW
VNLTCEQLVEMLLEYVDGGLPPEQVEAFKRHVCGCQPCDKTVIEYQFTMRVSRALPKVDPLPPAFEQRLRAALGQVSAGS